MQAAGAALRYLIKSEPPMRVPSYSTIWTSKKYEINAGFDSKDDHGEYVPVISLKVVSLIFQSQYCL